MNAARKRCSVAKRNNFGSAEQEAIQRTTLPSCKNAGLGRRD